MEIARVMRPRSCAKNLAGTCKEMLGTAQSVGCTVDHMHPQAVMAKVRGRRLTAPALLSVQAPVCVWGGVRLRGRVGGPSSLWSSLVQCVATTQYPAFSQPAACHSYARRSTLVRSRCQRRNWCLANRSCCALAAALWRTCSAGGRGPV